MHEQASPGTYHPNLLDFIGFLVRWLSSPSGNLLWDVLLQALGILFTVVILQRYLERREEMRWRPARYGVYFQLFGHVDWLVGLLPSSFLDRWPKAPHQFEVGTYVGRRFDAEFTKSVVSMSPSSLKDLVEDCASEPEILASFKRELDSILEHSAAVFLAREPDLNDRVRRLREHVSMAEGSLEVYREVQSSGVDPARPFGSSAVEQASIGLRELIVEGCLLRAWLARHAVIGESLVD